MKRILVSDGIERGAYESLVNKGYEVVEQFYTPEELQEKIKDFDVCVVRSATKIRQPIIDSSLTTGKLKLVIRGGVGVDNIDVDYAESKGVSVRNTPKASSSAVAELAIGHMFSVARFIHIANHTMRNGQWNKKNYEGVELRGKTLGLIGFGRIAFETAIRAHALGMNVIYFDQLGEKKGTDFRFSSFEDLLKTSDFISLHIPATPDKKPVISDNEFSMMKDGVYIINTARGGLVSEEALLRALDSGKVAGAGFDVFEEEPTKNERLYTHERISMTPHIAASTKEAQERIGEEIVSIIEEYFQK